MRVGGKMLGAWVVVVGLLTTPIGERHASAGAMQTAPAVVSVAVERANVRQSASPTATIVATVSRGDQLDVLGTSGAWYRVRIRPSNREGFIAMSTVEPVRANAPAAAPAAPSPAQAPAAPRPAPRPAASTPARAPAAQPDHAWHVRGIVGLDNFSSSAPDTFTALLGSALFSGLTAGADVYGGVLPFGLFARVGFAQFSADGERVFIVNGESFGTGIPLTVTMTPIQLGGGVRFRLGQPTTGGNRSIASRLTPYGGAGVVFLTYRETSEFADDGDNDAVKFRGFSAFGGVDVSLSSLLSAGVEAEFRQISGFGTGGVSESFGEDQLGGMSIKFLIGIGK